MIVAAGLAVLTRRPSYPLPLLTYATAQAQRLVLQITTPGSLAGAYFFDSFNHGRWLC